MRKYALLLLTVMAVLYIPKAVRAQSAAVDYYNLAHRWAPYVFQDTDSELFGSDSQDYISKLFFATSDLGQNWENLDDYPLRAYVYYSVVETETHYYIGYYFYHPRDWEGLKQDSTSTDKTLGEHEHDLEGVMMMLAKPADSSSDIVLVYTQAHKDTYYFMPGPMYGLEDVGEESCVLSQDHIDHLFGNQHCSVLATESIDLYTLTDSRYGYDRVAVFIECRGHGVGQIGRAMEPATSGISFGGTVYDFYGANGIEYYPSTTNTSGEPQGLDDEVEYALVPLYDEFYANRHSGSSENVFQDFVTIRTQRGVYLMDMGSYILSDGSPGKGANPPWYWDENSNCGEPGVCADDNDGIRGDWLLDPAHFVASHVPTLPALSFEGFGTYVQNEFLVGDNSINIANPGQITVGQPLEISWTYIEAASGTGMADNANIYFVYNGGSIHLTTVPLSDGSWTWNPVPPLTMPGPYSLEIICDSEVGSWLQVRDKLLICQSGIATIDAIQRYDPDTGNPASPHFGCPVTVEGRIFVVNGTYNNGTHYILDDNGNGIYFWVLSAPPLFYGDRVQVTGYIVSYAGELGFTSDFGTYPDPLVTFLANEVEPTPEVMSIAEVLYGVGGEDGYENVGKFVNVTGTVATIPGATYNHQFTIHNELGDTLVVYIDGSTLIDDADVDVGDIYRIISPVVKYNELIELKPRMQSDLLEEPGPHIYDIDCSNWVPQATDVITITARIEDSLMVTSASLHFRDDDGDSTGVFSYVSMTNTVGNTWSGAIPAPHTERQVDFYIEASNGTDTAYYPGNAPASWREVAVGITPIYEVQYCDPTQGQQGSSYYGRVVNLSGIVMVGTGDAGPVSKFIIQDDSGAFSGILVYESTAVCYVQAGDEVKVGGYIDEYYGLTEVTPHNASAVVIVSYSNDLFEATIVHCGTLSDDTLNDGDGVLGEAYESVWVTTFASTVVDTAGFNPYNTFRISDMPGDTLVVDAVVDLNYVAELGDIISVTGFLDYSYGAFKLVPLRDEDIEFTGETAVEGELPQLQTVGGLTYIAPNPFNPITEIRFVLARGNLVQLNIYNIRGELVRPLVNSRMDSGEYIVSWDGLDSAGQQSSSGTYFVRLRIGSGVLQVQKVMLVR